MTEKKKIDIFTRVKLQEKAHQNLDQQEAEQASFFYIDPQNWPWPDLKPPVYKPKRLRNSYERRLSRKNQSPRFVRVQHIEQTTPHGCQIPQSKLQSSKELLEKQCKEERLERPRWEARKQGIELIRKFHCSEVTLDEIRDFYKNQATILIPEQEYQAYKDYCRKNHKDAMPWPEYARQVVMELWATDFFRFSVVISFARPGLGTQRPTKFISRISWRKEKFMGKT